MATFYLATVWFLIVMSFAGKVAAAIGAVWSARYWIASSKAKVPPLKPNEGFRAVVITEDDGSDVLLTMKEQNRLNATAAKWAAVAAIGTIIATFLGLFGY